MPFNDLRRRVAADCKKRLGEPAIYKPKSGADIPTRVVVHRYRTDKHELTQARTTITVFRVGDAEDIPCATHGDTILLLGTAEQFRVDVPTDVRDEFKTVLAVTPHGKC